MAKRASESTDDVKWNAIDALRAALAGGDPDIEGLDVKVRSRKAARIRALAAKLNEIASFLDTTTLPKNRIELFSPSTIGRLLGRELADQVAIPLGELTPFYGSGVYALYYRGVLSTYRAIRGTTSPIYVGKGNPGRANQNARSPIEQGRGLYDRLKKHRENIDKSSNLSATDFTYRYLVTESGWQATAEEFLISLYRPIWNGPPNGPNICAGFGKHGDRARKERSAWDILHEGRAWAGGQASRRPRTPESIAEDIDRHFKALFGEAPEFWKNVLSRSWLSERSDQRC